MIDGFVADVCCVVNTVRADVNRDYGTGNNLIGTTARQAVRMPHHLDLAALDKLTQWVLFVTRFNARRRTLTPAELQVQHAAERLQDAIHRRTP
ncbi:MAG TPA: hypothetical protein VNJ02_19615 [Vicinamibacterales bacterium]|nr:hypothetical protein [Vicinamibacterales bacterium]